MPTTEKFEAVDVSTYFKYNACRTFCYRKYAANLEHTKFQWQNLHLCYDKRCSAKKIDQADKVVIPTM